VCLYLYLQFFLDFVTGNRRKSLGKGVFFGGEGDSVQGKRKGRLGKSYVDGACGDWGEYLWCLDMTGTCVEGIRKGRLAFGNGGRQNGYSRLKAGLGGVERFSVLAKGNANFAWVQHFIYHQEPSCAQSALGKAA